jgi:uncharacterized protein (TIRG00374 family)
MVGRLIYLVLGIGLLVWVGWHVDLAAVGAQLAALSPLLATAIVATYFLAFLVDTASWQLTLPSVRLDMGWLWRLWRIRMAGEALNAALPAASFGGEPAKMLLLKRRYDIGFGESTASLVMARTINLIGLILFLAAVMLIAAGDERLPVEAKSAAGIGLGAFVVGVGGFFVVQNKGIASRLLALFGRGRFAERVGTAIEHLQAAEARFAAFYSRSPGRFASAVMLALLNWLVGCVELWLTMKAVGVSLSFADAVVIEGVTQMVRAGSFFIPLSLGAQEGAMVVVTSALTGSTSAGLSAALVRRARELLFIVWGLWLGRDLAGRKPDEGESAS